VILCPPDGGTVAKATESFHLSGVAPTVSPAFFIYQRELRLSPRKSHPKKKPEPSSESKGTHGGSRPGAGKKPGTPNKSSVAMRELIDGVIDIRKIFAVWAREATRPLRKPYPRMTHVGFLCSVKLAEYRLGKPAQQLRITGEGSLTEEQMDSLRQIADKVMEESV
jgi:hypothetical protein